MQCKFCKYCFLSLAAGAAALILYAATLGGDIAPIRTVQDKYPVFADVAVDPQRNLVALSDENRFSLRTYARDLLSNAVAEPRTLVTGPKSGIEFVCGVAMDPQSQEIYAANNDTGAVLWQDRAFARAQLLYADGKLIVLDEDGTLGLATVSPQGLKVLARAQILEHLAWTPPTLVGTTLYVRDRRTIAAYDLR